MMKNKKEPPRNPWQLRDFPINLRLQISARAKLRGITTPQLLVQVVKKWLDEPEQRQELPVPQGVLDDV